MITKKTLSLGVIIFICATCIYSADAARGGGGGRFGGGSRFSSSRYSSSSSYRYSSSRYSSSRYSSTRYSYRSYRSYRSYYMRYSSRYRYRSSYYSRGSTVAVSKIGMGGLTGNKEALLLAGSVYVAYSVRTQIFIRSGVLFYGVLDDYAICSGLVRWDPVSKNGSYAYDDLDLDNQTATNSIMTTRAVAVPTASPSYGNGTVYDDGTVVTTAQTPGSFVTYNYFMCPNDLFDNKYESEDTYCCGPSGSQMCCSEDDFNEQLGNTADGTLTTVLIFVSIFIAGVCVLLYLFRKKIRNKCRRGDTSTPAARPDVTFHQVSKSGDEPQVVFAGGSKIGGGQPNAADNNAPSNSVSEQPTYPLHPTGGSGGGSNPAPFYSLYPPQAEGGAQPQYSLYPPVNGDGARQPPLHPPPSYADAQY